MNKDIYSEFRIDDDSMADGAEFSLEEGDIVLARRVKPEYWEKELKIDKFNFVLQFKNGDYIVRQILRHDVDKRLLFCHPKNPFYEDKIISLNDLSNLYNILRFTSKAGRSIN